MNKRNSYLIGMSLILQALSSVALFFILLLKKKSVAYAFLTVGAIQGLAGSYLLWQDKLQRSLDSENFNVDDRLDDIDEEEFKAELFDTDDFEKETKSN